MRRDICILLFLAVGVLTIEIFLVPLFTGQSLRFGDLFVDHRGAVGSDHSLDAPSLMPLPDLTSEIDSQLCKSDKYLKRDKTEPQQKTKLRKAQHRIPRIIHQTSKSRCLTEGLHNATMLWDFPEWSYYFHDDDAVERLFHQNFPEFPHLKLVAESCLLSGTAKADLWRYLVLWQYGGVYADIDSAPHSFFGDTIQPADDGFFVVEQYHILSQYFIAVSPRHPLMYYAIQRALLNIMQVPDTGRFNAASVTGPHALHAGFQDFRRDAGVIVDPAGKGQKPVWKGKFPGTAKRSITVVGVGEKENEYVWRSLVKKGLKVKEYASMGMAHFDDFTKEDKSTNTTCLSAILRSKNADASFYLDLFRS